MKFISSIGEFTEPGQQVDTTLDMTTTHKFPPQTAVKAVSAAVRKAGITDLFGVAGNTNVQVLCTDSSESEI